jgi:hypothetical protein
VLKVARDPVEEGVGADVQDVGADRLDLVGLAAALAAPILTGTSLKVVSLVFLVL